MAPNIKVEPSEAVSVTLPAEVMAKSKNVGLATLLPPSVDPAVAAAIRAVDRAVLLSINGTQVTKANIPFPLQIKAECLSSDKPTSVQVCGSTSLGELARAIDCELGVPAHLRRLVVMGRTLYNHGFEHGTTNDHITLNRAGITAHHVVWVKPSDASIAVRRFM